MKRKKEKCGRRESSEGGPGRSHFRCPMVRERRLSCNSPTAVGRMRCQEASRRVRGRAWPHPHVAKSGARFCVSAKSHALDVRRQRCVLQIAVYMRGLVSSHPGRPRYTHNRILGFSWGSSIPTPGLSTATAFCPSSRRCFWFRHANLWTCRRFANRKGGSAEGGSARRAVQRRAVHSIDEFLIGHRNHSWRGPLSGALRQGSERGPLPETAPKVLRKNWTKFRPKKKQVSSPREKDKEK